MLRRFEAITEAGYPYLVAELDGQVLGYAYANAYRTRPAYRFTVENSIYIAARRAGQRRRPALLAALIDACTARGLPADDGRDRRLRRSTLRSRCIAACGFTFCGTIHSVGYKYGRWLDSVIMQLPLGAGDRHQPPRRHVLKQPRPIALRASTSGRARPARGRDHGRA